MQSASHNVYNAQIFRILIMFGHAKLHSLVYNVHSCLMESNMLFQFISNMYILY